MPNTELSEAEAWLDQGRVAEALMAAETAVAGGVAAATPLRDRAMSAIQAMDPTFAALQLAAAVHANRPQAHLDLGEAWLAQDRAAHAERCFKQALALDPRSAEAHAALARAYHHVGIDDGAEHHCLQALELEPAHVVASQTLAAILEARGEHAAARVLLDQAYRRQALFDQPAVQPQMRVLVLATASTGNVPYRTLMPPMRYSRLVWYMEYARAEDTPDPSAYDLVFNAIGDADMAAPSALAVDRFVAGCPKAVLNDPARVARTRRDLTSDFLAGLEDVVVPRTVRLTAADIAADGLRALARRVGMDGPVLVRPAGAHGGQGLRRAAGVDGLGEAPPGVDLYLTAYVDYRSADGLFRKYRMLFVDRRPYPYHQAIADSWLVHHGTSGMDSHAGRREEEMRFLADPEGAIGARAMAAIARIGRALDLDYAGIDFGVLPDGQVLVFEANATMLAHLEDASGLLAQKNPYVLVISEAFQALLARKAQERS